ncbi:MAG: UDP-N-acetylmuramoyl-L-alanyl-D-glutamate--2,6-diaminopimelate ligase [bacterium]
MKKIVKKLKTIKWQIKSEVAKYRYGNPASKLKIVGVTGTNGKTTTATLLYRTAIALGHKAGFIGTTNIMSNEKELKMDLRTSTTPDKMALTKIFAEMVKDNCEYVFMEVSSHALDQKRVAGINFVGGIFTNLTQDHLDYHKSMENYFLTKKKFFQMLPASAFALSNADEEHGLMMTEGIKAKKYFYGFDSPETRFRGNSPKPGFGERGLDFEATILNLDFNGLELLFNMEHVKSNLLGKFNAYNLLAVWSACKLLGFDIHEVAKILENIEPPTGRFQHFVSDSGVMGIVDYAHSPDSLEKVLKTINEIKEKNAKVICVFGCGGDRDPLKRRIMGKIGATLSDIPIFTSDNPRNEDPEKIIAEMKTDLSMAEVAKIKSIANRREAIQEAVKLAGKGDIILLAGKGHEDYQEIKGVKNHFDDMEELKKALC